MKSLNHTIQYGLEIGSCNGPTLYMLSQLSSDNATLISIDLETDGDTHRRMVLGEDKINFFSSLCKENQTIYTLTKNSHLQETLDDVISILGENKLDYLFIDADHSYNGISKDFEMYSPLVKEKGIIGFHDILSLDNQDCGLFFNSIKKNYITIEIGIPLLEQVRDENYKPDETSPMGIGILINKVINNGRNFII